MNSILKKYEAKHGSNNPVVVVWNFISFFWERLKEIMEKDAGRDGQAAAHRLDGHSEYDLGEDTEREARKPSVNERLKDVLNKPREKMEIEEERDDEQEVEKDRDIDLGPTH